MQSTWNRTPRCSLKQLAFIGSNDKQCFPLTAPHGKFQKVRGNRIRGKTAEEPTRGEM